MKNMVELANSIAVKAHKGQKDKGGKEYIYHPLTVEGFMETDEERIVALLHDVIEDTSVSLEDLTQDGFSTNVLEAIKAITKIKGQSYEEYIEEVKSSKLAVKVKIADLTHNSDLSRISNPKQSDFERVKKYQKTKEMLDKFLVENE